MNTIMQLITFNIKVDNCCCFIFYDIYRLFIVITFYFTNTFEKFLNSHLSLQRGFLHKFLAHTVQIRWEIKIKMSFALGSKYAVRKRWEWIFSHIKCLQDGNAIFCILAFSFYSCNFHSDILTDMLKIVPKRWAKSYTRFQKTRK